MTWFPDLHAYRYAEERLETGGRPLSVGWLDKAHAFGKAMPSEEFLERLWMLCTIAVNQTRGLHKCEFCRYDAHLAQRGDRKLTLGSAEIRVFTNNGATLAAPNLIYHYVRHHHYAPPDLFTEAVLEEPVPPDDAYFAQLKQRGFAWGAAMETWGERFRFERNEDGELERVNLPLNPPPE